MAEPAAPEPEARERRLTVSRLFAPRARPVAYSAPATVVPFLRISGRWLSALGFEPGDRVRVEGEPGRLQVTRVSPGAEAS